MGGVCRKRCRADSGGEWAANIARPAESSGEESAQKRIALGGIIAFGANHLRVFIRRLFHRRERFFVGLIDSERRFESASRARRRGEAKNLDSPPLARYRARDRLRRFVMAGRLRGD